jgi:hypothetical protein
LILDLLLPFVDGEPKILELFARSLMPNTTSCGYEVLKLQHDFLFQKVNKAGKRKTFFRDLFIFYSQTLEVHRRRI